MAFALHIYPPVCSISLAVCGIHIFDVINAHCTIDGLAAAAFSKLIDSQPQQVDHVQSLLKLHRKTVGLLFARAGSSSFVVSTDEQNSQYLPLCNKYHITLSNKAMRVC